MWYVTYVAWPDSECIDAAYGPFETEEAAEEYAYEYMDSWDVRELSKKEANHYMVDEPE